jgi:hypothetical protein
VQYRADRRIRERLTPLAETIRLAAGQDQQAEQTTDPEDENSPNARKWRDRIVTGQRARTGDTMRAIFLSYRRDDGSGHAGRLHDRLVCDFGRERVFMDVNAIAPGTNFPEVITRSISMAGIVLVVIGSRWVDAVNQAGGRRLDESNDYVRLEIAAALGARVPLIPVLVENASMPPPAKLPAEIQEFCSKQACALSDFSYDLDYAQLRELVSRHLAEGMLKDISLQQFFAFIEDMKRALNAAPLQEQRISGSLVSLDPIARIEAYLELQLRPRKGCLRDLLAALYLEHNLALRTIETRPLWHLVEALHRYAEAFSPLDVEVRNEVEFALNQSLELLEHNTRLDVGREVKRSIGALLNAKLSA